MAIRSQPTASRAVLAWVLLVGLSGCGRPQQNQDPQPVQDAADRELLERGYVAPEPQRWHHDPPPMPQAFTEFLVPALADLDGMWLVPSEIPGHRELWVLSAKDEMLTIVDRHGRERRYGLAVLSPCSLRLTDPRGRGRTRLVARSGSDLYVATGGAMALRSPEGAFLACVGTRNYRLEIDGTCHLHTEMLGIWEQRDAKAEHCHLDGEQLTMDDETLTAHGALWLDEVAAQAKAERVTDRKAAEALLGAEPETEPAATGDETGSDTTAGSDTAGSDTAGSDTTG